MKRLPILFATLSGTLALAACVPPAAPSVTGRRDALPPPRVSAPRPSPAPLPADWRERPYTPGDWVYRQDARGSIALFGPPDADALLALRCDGGARQLYLSHPGAAAAAMTVRTTSLTRTLPAAPTGATPPYVAAMLGPRDPLLDAMAFSRGRIAVSLPGTTPLTVPAWAEIGRVVEDCRP